MEKIIVEGVEVHFDDFTNDVQRKLYLQNKEKFEKEAAKSESHAIRRMLIADENTSLEILEEIFKVEIEVYGNIQNLIMILEHPNFSMDDEKRRELAYSDSEEIKLIAAEDEDSSCELLNEILCNTIKNDTVEEYEVIEAVLNNPNFIMEEETRKMLVESKYSCYRGIAAEEKNSSSKLLNELLRKELNEENDWDVIEAILSNPNFTMEDETREMLAKSDDYECRQFAAKGASSAFLNEMFRIEIEEKRWSVIEAILKEPNFKMEDETRNLLAKSDDYEYRQIAAKDKDASSEFLENMYITETDEDVLEVIELNLMLKINKTSITLNAVQKRRILEVLKELKNSKKKHPLKKYVEQILKIIG